MRVTMCVLLLTLASPALADELVLCRVRIDANERVADGEGRAPTLEEAVDVASENACALICSGNAESSEEEGELVEATSAEEVEASDDPQGFEQCVSDCTEEAVTMGLVCYDQRADVLAAEGVFETDSGEESDEGEADE